MLLLDHEAVHGQEWGSYHGTVGDVSMIRNILLEIKK